MTIKRLPREHELIEFRPVPGVRSEWAAGSEAEIRSPLWDWLGLFPLLGFISIYIGLIGISL